MSNLKSPVSNLKNLVHFPTWPTLRVVGPDSASWLHGIITCDVTSVKDGVGMWGSLLSKQGKIQADLQIVGHAHELYVGISGGNERDVLSTLDGYLVMEDAEIEEANANWVLFAGPDALARAREFGVDGARINWGTSVVLGRVESKDLERIRAEVSTSSDDEFHAWKTANGVPTFGRDYTATDNPHAASLERRTVDWSKGCYLGQEVVCMQDMRGKVKRRLVGLSGDFFASVGETVKGASGQVVGEIKSSTRSHAIAMVSAPDYEHGTTLTVSGAEVVVRSLN